MTSDQFRAYLDRFGLSQHAAGRFFDVDERTVRRWASGDLPIPRSVEMVFILMDEFMLDCDVVDEMLKAEGARA